MDKLEESIFQSILYGRNAEASCTEAVLAAEDGDFKAAGEKLMEAEASIQASRHIEAFLMQEKIQEEILLLLDGAQNQIISAAAAKKLAADIIRFYLEMKEPEEEAL